MTLKSSIGVFILISLISCDNTNYYSSQEETPIQKRKFDTILDRLFKDKYPNYTKNEIVRENSLKELLKNVDSVLPLNYFNDIPLKVLKLSKNPHGKGAIVHLFADNYESDRDILSDRLECDVIGYMDEEGASKIVDSRKYFISGKKFKRLTKAEAFALVDQVYYSPNAEISKDAVYNSIYNFNIGSLLCEIDSLILANK